MTEFGALFVADYMIASLFLLPLLGLYLGLILKNASLGPLMGFHKAILLLSIALPIGMVLVSHNHSSQSSSLNTQAIDKTAAIGTYVGVPGDPLNADSSANRFPPIQDVVFYFVDLIGLFSILGLLIFVMRYAMQAGRLNRIRQDSVVSKIDNDCLLIESTGISLPFSVGVFRKKIFIPADMPSSEKTVVVQHELNHFRYRHHFWSLLEALLACVFWFNPITHILRRRGTFLRELECDKRTIQTVDRYAYTRLLLKTAESMAGGGPNSRFSLITQGWARNGELKMRVENLISKENTKRKITVAVLVAVAVALTAGMAMVYGNLNEAKIQREVLAKISIKYQERAPETTRIEIDKVPGHFVNALLVGQDSRFYEHRGMSVRSVIRAAGANLGSFLSGGPLFKHGGSTITQQLAKQFIDNPERTLKRKFEELKIARVIEGNLTKDAILEMYLNMVYFGNGAYGLKAASDRYFGHDYTQLTLSESAMLIPFLDAPAKYNLLEDPVTAEKRQKHLLERIAATDASAHVEKTVPPKDQTQSTANEPERELPIKKISESQMTKEKRLVITISREGMIYYSSKPINFRDIQKHLKKDAKSPKDSIYLRADKDVKWNSIVSVTDAIRAAGFTEIRLVTEPFKKPLKP